MTIDECAKMLIAKIECMKRETSGTDTDCNAQKCDDCSLCYEQGTIGQQKEALMYAVDIMRKYKMLQADYKARLKADMVAMLKDLQSEIEKMQSVHCDYHGDWCIDRDKVWEIIQQKINVIKEQKDGTNEKTSD